MRRRADLLRRRGVWGAALLAAGMAGCAPQPAPVAVAPPAPPPLAAAPPPAARVPPLPPVGALPEPFRQVAVVFYQPDAVLKARFGDDAAPLAGYIRRIDSRAGDVAARAGLGRGYQVALVIVLKPGGESRAWLVTRAKLSPALRDGLVAAAQAVPAPAVQGGKVAFAIIFDGQGGGGPPVVDAAHPVPIPPEWRKGVSPLGLQGPAPPPLSQ